MSRNPRARAPAVIALNSATANLGIRGVHDQRVDAEIILDRIQAAGEAGQLKIGLMKIQSTRGRGVSSIAVRPRIAAATRALLAVPASGSIPAASPTAKSPGIVVSPEAERTG